MPLFWISLSLCIFHSLRLAIAASGNCDVAPLSLPWSNVTVSTNGVAVTRGIELGIGTPNQIFSLRPSTTLNNTRLSNVLDCGSEANTSCVGGKGGVYDSSKSSTFSVSIKDRWNGSAADTETATGSYVYFNDFIDFGPDNSIWGFPLVEDSDLVSGTEAGLPLGENSSFLAAVTEANVAPSKAWGLWAGDRSLSPADGALTIGGYDPARVAGNFTTFPLGNWTLQQPCPLQVTVSSIMYNQPNGNSDLLTSENMVACIEPFQDHFTFTPDVVNKFANVTGYNSSYPGLTYPTAQAPDGNLTITLENNYTTVVPNSELVALMRGSDQLGQYVITNSSVVETEIIYNAQSDPTTVQPILGGIYLTFNYLVVDYESGQFQLAPAVQANQPTSSQAIKVICTPTPTSSPTSSGYPAPSPQNSSSKTGAIVGGTVGGVAGLAIMGVLVLLFRRHRQHRWAEESTIAPSDRAAEWITPSDGAAQWSPSVQSPTLSEKEAPLSPSELPLSLASSVHELPGTPRLELLSRALNRRSRTLP